VVFVCSNISLCRWTFRIGHMFLRKFFSQWQILSPCNMAYYRCKNVAYHLPSKIQICLQVRHSISLRIFFLSCANFEKFCFVCLVHSFVINPRIASDKWIHTLGYCGAMKRALCFLEFPGSNHLQTFNHINIWHEFYTNILLQKYERRMQNTGY